MDLSRILQIVLEALALATIPVLVKMLGDFVAGLIEDEGENKKQYTVNLAERWLAQFGIQLELDTR